MSNSDFEPSTADDDDNDVIVSSPKKARKDPKKKKFSPSKIRAHPFFPPTLPKKSVKVILKGKACPQCRHYRSTVDTLMDIHLIKVHKIRRAGTTSGSSDFSPNSSFNSKQQVKVSEQEMNNSPNSSLNSAVPASPSGHRKDSSDLENYSTSPSHVSRDDENLQNVKDDDDTNDDQSGLPNLNVSTEDDQFESSTFDVQKEAVANDKSLSTIHPNVTLYNADLAKVISNGHTKVPIPKLQQKDMSNCEQKDILSDFNPKDRMCQADRQNSVDNSDQNCIKPAATQLKDVLSRVQLNDTKQDTQSKSETAFINSQLKERLSNGEPKDNLSISHLKDTLSVKDMSQSEKAIQDISANGDENDSTKNNDFNFSRNEKVFQMSVN